MCGSQTSVDKRNVPRTDMSLPTLRGERAPGQGVAEGLSVRRDHMGANADGRGEGKKQNFKFQNIIMIALSSVVFHLSERGRWWWLMYEFVMVTTHPPKKKNIQKKNTFPANVRG